MDQKSSIKRLKSKTSEPADKAVKRHGWVTADFFVPSYRISGSVDVHRLPLADQLDNPSVSYLMLEDAYVSPIERPGDITAGYTMAALRKGNVMMVVLSSKDDGTSKKRSYGSYFGVSLLNVFITVPQFEIRGYLEVVGKFDLYALLATGTDRFIPILEGTTFASFNPQFQFDGGMILVNKEVIGSMCVEKE